MKSKNHFSHTWEKETRKANDLFKNGLKDEAKFIYKTLYQELSKIINEQKNISEKTLIQLLITNDNIIEILAKDEGRLEKIKLQTSTLKTLIEVINKDNSNIEDLSKLFNQAYFNYCQIINGVHLKFSQKVSNKILGDKLSFDKFHFSLKFDQVKNLNT